VDPTAERQHRYARQVLAWRNHEHDCNALLDVLLMACASSEPTRVTLSRSEECIRVLLSYVSVAVPYKAHGPDSAAGNAAGGDRSHLSASGSRPGARAPISSNTHAAGSASFTLPPFSPRVLRKCYRLLQLLLPLVTPITVAPLLPLDILAEFARSRLFGLRSTTHASATSAAETSSSSSPRVKSAVPAAAGVNAGSRASGSTSPRRTSPSAPGPVGSTAAAPSNAMALPALLLRQLGFCNTAVTRWVHGLMPY